MKRCPQCEFIYEDDQSLCDMDGVLLVFDSRTLPNLALATVSGPIPEKAPRRSRMVPAFATLILMLGIASVYYVSTMRNVATVDYAPASVTSTTAEPAVVPPAPAEDPNQAQAPAAEPSPEAAEEPPKENPRETQAAPGAKPAAAPARRTPTTKSEPKKNDSKVESILKKTGKILKKPFKF